MFLFALARGANVNDQRWLARRQQFRGKRRAQALRDRYEFRPRLETVHPVLQIPGYVIEPDAAKPDGGLGFPPWRGEDHDRMRAIEHGSGPSRILPPSSDVDAARQVHCTKLVRSASVEDLRPFCF